MANSTTLKEGTFTGNILSSTYLDRYVLTETFHAQNQEVPKHTHEHCYLSLLLNGFYEENSIVATEGVSAGTTLIRTHDYEHKNKIGCVGGICFNLEIKNEQFKESIEKLPQKYLRLEHFNVDTINVYLAFKRGFQHDILGLIVEESLYTLLENNHGGRLLQKNHWVKKVQDQVKDAPSAKYGIDQLSNSLGLHPVYFVRKFKERTGINFSEFVIKQRLSAAIQLMHENHKNLTEIALEAGFYDQSHFIKRFREKFQITPSQYQKIITG